MNKQAQGALNFDPYPATSYQDVDLTGLAAFAIKQLNDLQIPNTFENLVVALFKLFPDKFSLVGYEQFPDAARVNRSLLQLGPKYRNWARGSVQTGFVLTDSGARKAADVAARLVSGTNAGGNKRRSVSRTRLRTIDLSKEIRAIEQSALYRRWQSKSLEDGTSMELFDLLGAYAYTPKRVLKERVGSLERLAEEIERADILDFLHAIRRTFSQQLRD